MDFFPATKWDLSQCASLRSPHLAETHLYIFLEIKKNFSQVPIQEEHPHCPVLGGTLYRCWLSFINTYLP